MAFRHEQHRQIQKILRRFDASCFEDMGAPFGGGTLLALENDEYRVSFDIDVFADTTAYREVRKRVHSGGFGALFSGPAVPDGETRVNRDKVLFKLDGVKIEIIHEVRISLEPPVQLDWCPIPCLHPIDRVATKLLANADRWNDPAALSRDLIDLCILIQVSSEEDWQRGFEKAVNVECTNSVKEGLHNALAEIESNSDKLPSILKIFEIENTDVFRAGLNKLKPFRS